MIDNILLVGAVAGAVAAIYGLIVKIAKPIKSIAERFDDMESNIKELKGEVLQLKQSNTISESALKSVLRNNITNVYYKNIDSETLREYEFEEMIQACECYFELGGNSYVRELYERMCGWKVIS